MSVLSYLQSRSSSAVLSVTEKASIATSISTLQTRLNSYFGAKLSSHFTFGSYTRDTILPRSMDARSDIDYMVVFADSGYQPQTYLDRLRGFVEYWYSSSQIYQSSPTIVLELNHIRFELVPALAYVLGGYQIPAGLSSWQLTDPNDVNTKLSDKNKACAYNIKPVVRLAKLWNASNGPVFDSYWLEKHIIGQFFYLCSNQRDYLFAVMDALPTPTNVQWRKDKVDRAKRIVAQVRSYESSGYLVSAETEVKKLIPA